MRSGQQYKLKYLDRYTMGRPHPSALTLDPVDMYMVGISLNQSRHRTTLGGRRPRPS